MRYRGESPAKKVARLAFWRRAKQQLGPRFFTGIHVVLLSAEAGDVSVLLGLGVAPSHILGVDTDKHAVAAANHRFNDIRTYRGDVATAARHIKNQGGKIVSAHLDFCARISDTSLGKVAEVSKYMEPGAILGCAFLAGREQGKWRTAVADAKHKMQMRCGNQSFALRSDMITTELVRRCRSYRRYPNPEAFWYYVSHSPGRFGKPMIVCQLKLLTRLPRSIRAELNHSHYEYVQATTFELGALAAQIEEDEEQADLLLNAKRGSVAAWKAHATRGTYKP